MQNSTEKMLALSTQELKASRLQPLKPHHLKEPEPLDLCHHINQKLFQVEKNLAYFNFAIKELKEINLSG